VIRLLAVSLLVSAGSGCGLLFPASPDGAAAPGSTPPQPEPTGSLDSELVPIGRGTLRQEEISISLRRGDLEVRVTPLEEAVIRVTAPDTYERLAALARGHQEIFLERTGSAAPFRLFLVSLNSETIETSFEPEALNLVSRGLRYRPADVRPLTPEWETRRLRPREALLAVYAFPAELDLGQDLEVEYQEVRSREWSRLLPLIEAERARVRTRR
jgi:hypothetical protein